YQDGALGDVWALSLSGAPAWSEVTASGPQPPARFSHAGIYDPVRDRMIIFGGYLGDAFDNSVWALSLSGAPEWAPVAAEGTPPTPRDAMTAVYDPVRDRMLVFGGWAATTFDGNVWALSLSGTPTWSTLATAGTGPSPRRHYAAVYDATGDRLVV